MALSNIGMEPTTNLETKMRISLHAEAEKIERAIKEGALDTLTEFKDVYPDSRLAVAKATIAAYRENATHSSVTRTALGMGYRSAS